ncbi:apoptosis facilitator Bcl-2-like protein 14 [Silurus meridionalis]|uniref:apoptosis facilitator Bcl-2-like protein 14 n=1 Tax=Silurus meridionalis TaxID=175797 RepID=UPI001EEC1786|nr:apoptosis facilitator Bcl-2-like protein 14 [Silurus meridionalis]
MANGTQDQTVDQAEQLALLFPKDSIEYKLLLRYTQKKTHSQPPQSNGVGETKTGSPTKFRGHNKPNKSKKFHLQKVFSCIQPAKKKPVRQQASTFPGPHQGEVEQIVNRLTEITDHVHFITSDIETDSDDVVERLVELIREHGDKLNEKIERDHMLRKNLQDCFSYTFFKQVTQMFMRRLSPEEHPTTQSPEQAKIALTCELTSRLNTMDCLPMNRALGFGGKYLQDYFTPWVIEQGGYEKVFCTPVDEDEEVH